MRPAPFPPAPPYAARHVVTLLVEKRWTWRDDAYASRRIEDPRIDVAKLGLVPLPLDGGERVDLRSAYEPYRRPDPYAPLAEAGDEAARGLRDGSDRVGRLSRLGSRERPDE